MRNVQSVAEMIGKYMFSLNFTDVHGDSRVMDSRFVDLFVYWTETGQFRLAQIPTHRKIFVYKTRYTG